MENQRKYWKQRLKNKSPKIRWIHLKRIQSRRKLKSRIKSSLWWEKSPLTLHSNHQERLPNGNLNRISIERTKELKQKLEINPPWNYSRYTNRYFLMIKIFMFILFFKKVFFWTDFFIVSQEKNIWQYDYMILFNKS